MGHALLSAAETIEDQQDNEVEMTIVNPAASVAQVNSARELKDLQDKNLELSQMNDTLAAARLKASKQNNQLKKRETNSVLNRQVLVMILKFFRLKKRLMIMICRLNKNMSTQSNNLHL